METAAYLGGKLCLHSSGDNTTEPFFDDVYHEVGDRINAADTIDIVGLRNQVAVRTVQEVVSGQRDQLMLAITAQLNEVANEELGVEVIDVRVKKIDLPPDVSESVYRRMNAEREKEARELRSEGKELAEGIRAAADREVTVIEANAFRDAEIVRGNGDAEATRIYAEAFNQDPEFYSFTRSLQAYRDTFNAGSDVMLLQPDSEFFKYLRNPNSGD